MTKMTREEFYNLYRGRPRNNDGHFINVEDEIKNVLNINVWDDDYEDYLNDDLILIAPREQD